MDLLETTKPQWDCVINKGGQLWACANWMSRDHCCTLFERLMAELLWKQETLFIYGRTVKTPRLVAWYGDVDYSYSGTLHEATPWHPALLDLKVAICDALKRQLERDVTLNSVLCNLYRDGNDSMGWHSDDEPELGKNPLIVSFSLGASRFFDCRNIKPQQSKQPHHEKHRLNIQSGTLILMQGTFQHHWQHQVPKQKRITEPRINLTFRYIYS